VPSVETSHVLYPSPSSRVSDEVIIPHRLGDVNLGFLYGTKGTSLIVRHLLRDKTHCKSVFDIVVAGAFQITFRVKMHVNDVFSFFKNYFWHQHIKTIQNVQTILNFSKKKFQIFWERGLNRVPKRFINHVEQYLMVGLPYCKYEYTSSVQLLF